MERRKVTDAIVIHCSATPEGRELGVEDVRRWHRARGFEDVGYHYIIKMDGTVEKGRAEDCVGAHCVESGMNRRSVGVCYIGGMDKGMKHPKDTRTEAQRKSLIKLTCELQRKYSIPDSRVFGHRDFAKKACPSFDVRSMFLSVLVVLSLVATGCTRKIYLPVESSDVRRDTVYVSKSSSYVVADKDTVRIVDKGDTVFAESVKWRWRERVVHDTARQAALDSIAVREPVPVEAAAGGGASRSRLFNIMMAAAMAVGLWHVFIERKSGSQ